jgi:hypothetical protein
MGIFSNIDSAKGSEKSNYFLPGVYTAEIQRCKQGRTRKGVDFFVAEFKLLESSNPERAAGSSVSYMVMLPAGDDEKMRLGLGNVADFMRAGLAAFAAQTEGVTMEPSTVPLDEETAEKVTGEENMLAGVVIKAEAFNAPTKAGTDFTRLKWFVVPGAVKKVA